MIDRIPVCAVVFFLAATPALAGPAADAVRYFYDNTGVESTIETRDRFTGPAKEYLDANDRAWDNHEQVCLDFSFVIDGQDADDAEVASTLDLVESVEGDEAFVTASFSNFGMAHAIDWHLVEEDGAWKVFDVASADGAWRLSELSCPA